MSFHKHSLKSFILLALVLFFSVNFMAFNQVHSMTVFSGEARRTDHAENLSILGKTKTLIFGVKNPRPENRVTPESIHQAFTAHRFPGSHGMTLEAWHIAAPQSTKTALIFHGYAGSKDKMLPVVPVLLEAGFSCFLVDFYGSGGSTGADTSIGFYETEDVLQAYSYAREHWPKNQIVTYSVSMGSAAVLKAFQNERFAPSLIMLESPFDSLLHTTRNRFTLMGLPSFPLAELLVFWGGVQQGYNAFAHNPAKYARNVSVPSLLMYGEKDNKVLPVERERVFEALKGVKTFKVIPGAGHGLLAGSSPEEWGRSVKDFLGFQQEKVS